MGLTMERRQGETSQEVAELFDELFEFVRAFGLHRTDETPCGVPMSVSEAQAMTLLLEGPATPSQLADRLALARSTVSRLLERLDTEGWIGRQPDPADGRRATDGRAGALRSSPPAGRVAGQHRRAGSGGRRPLAASAR